MKKVFLYSFEKFGKLQSNPAAEVGQQIVELFADDASIKFHVLPSTFDYWNTFREIIDAFQPDFIIGLGVAPGRPRICVETVALNVIDTSTPDNAGATKRHEQIIKDAALAIASSIDIQSLCDLFKKHNIPTKISYNAGTYICNYIHYLILHHVKKQNRSTKVGFVHVPMSPQEINTLDMEAPSFPTILIAEVLKEYISNLH